MVLPTQDAPGSSVNQLHRHGDLDRLQGGSWAGTVSREHCGGVTGVLGRSNSHERSEENGARL